MSNNKYLIIAHQLVIFFSNIMSIIIVKGTTKLINKRSKNKQSKYLDNYDNETSMNI